jgi:hypothetical protein
VQEKFWENLKLPPYKQGDQIWRNFSIWATFLHFHFNKEFESAVFVGILRDQKWFHVDDLNFQNEI